MDTITSSLIYDRALAHKDDYNEFITNLTMAANLGYSPAIEALHMEYFSDNDRKQDFSVTKKFYEATMHYGYSCNYLAFMYKYGLGVEKNYRKANELFEKAVALGSPLAMVNLGCSYRHGHGVTVDYDKAAQLYQQAINVSEKFGYDGLGTLYRDGEGVDKNINKTVELYEEGAKHNNPFAMRELAILYRDGTGVERNYDKAFSLLKKTAKFNYSRAVSDLATFQCNGWGIESDYISALALYEKAAEQGSGDAVRNIGFMYFHGLGVNVDIDKAMECYKKAIEIGDPVAKNLLVELYTKHKCAYPEDEIIEYFLEKKPEALTEIFGYDAEKISLLEKIHELQKENAEWKSKFGIDI